MRPQSGSDRAPIRLEVGDSGCRARHTHSVMVRSRSAAVPAPVLPAALTVAIVLEQVVVHAPHAFLVIAGAVVMGVALAWRRRLPLLAIVTVAVVLGVEPILGVSTARTSMPILPAFWVVFLAFAALTGRRRAVALISIAGSVGLSLLFDGGRFDPGNALHGAVFAIAVCIPAAVTGGYVATRHRYTELLEEQARLVQRQREIEAAAAVADERVRIARELHDVIAHGVGVMGVQAAAVRRLLRSDQAELRDALLSVEDTARNAIEELGRVLHVLRDQKALPTSAPQPDLSEVATLVDLARSAGQQVVLDIVGEPGAVPSGVSVSSYRIVQEALTNARKHAPGQPVRVAISCQPDTATLEVRNAVSAALPPQRATGGHGLIGMRERVAAFSGTLHAEAVDGQFVVRAVLPLHSAVTAP